MLQSYPCVTFCVIGVISTVKSKTKYMSLSKKRILLVFVYFIKSEVNVEAQPGWYNFPELWLLEWVAKV